MDWSSFQRTGLCLLRYGMLLDPTTVRSGFPLVYSCLKDPERACLEHFTGTSCWGQARGLSHFKAERIHGFILACRFLERKC